MSKLKKILLMGVVYVLVAVLAIGGTVAYLTDTDSAVNVMTLGNVSIEQHEYERVQNGDGTYEMVTSPKYGEGYKLQAFTQAKPLYPATGEITGWGTKVPFDQIEGASGAQSVFAGLNNVQDKFVLVENTGKNDAYVRTLIALEYGSNVKDIIGISTGDFWTWNEIGIIEVDGNNYFLFEAIYKGSDTRHVGGVLPVGEYTYNSLGQIYLSNEATDEDCEKLDGNKNGTYDILVFSQAVQAAGFDSAEIALDAAFGNITETQHPWSDAKVIIPEHFVSDLEGLKEAFAEGGNIQLTGDVEFEKLTSIEPGKEVYLDLNGKTITVDEDTKSNTLIWVKEGAKLTIDGNGTFDLGSVSTMAIFAPYGELVIENGTFIRDEVTEVTNKTTGLFMGCKSIASKVTINGGYFDPGYYDENAADIEEILAGTAEFIETADDIAKRGNSKDANKVRVAIKDNVSVLLNHSGYGTFKVYGGTFVGANPAWGDEGCMLPTTPNYLRPWSYYQGALLDGQTFNENGLVIPDGYTITRSVNADGVPVYTVEYNK